VSLLLKKALCLRAEFCSAWTTALANRPAISPDSQMLGILDFDRLFSYDFPKVRPHVEFDSRFIRTVRHADGLITYPASPKAHLLLFRGLSVFH